MLKKEVQILNDQVDKHGHRMSIDALQSAMQQTNEKIMSSHNEHDFSTPPIGRVEEATLVKNQNINWLIGNFSLFEIDDIERENPIQEKELAIHSQEPGAVTVYYDKSYEDDGLIPDIEEIQRLFDKNGSAQYELKKSVEPVSTLTLLIGAGVFVAAGFLNGFLGEAGKDSWSAIKNIIKKRKDKKNESQHYQFIYIFQNEYYKAEVMLIFKNPEPDDIEKIITSNQKNIEDKVIKYYEDEVRVRRIVFLAEGLSIRHIYSVYKCGTPFDIADREKYEAVLSSKKSEI